jgi:hypothetical protein
MSLHNAIILNVSFTHTQFDNVCPSLISFYWCDVICPQGTHNNEKQIWSSVVTVGREIAARLKAPGRPFGVTEQREQFLSASAEFRASRPNTPLCSACLTKKSSKTGGFLSSSRDCDRTIGNCWPIAEIQEMFRTLFYINLLKTKFLLKWGKTNIYVSLCNNFHLSVFSFAFVIYFWKCKDTLWAPRMYTVT